MTTAMKENDSPSPRSNQLVPQLLGCIVMSASPVLAGIFDWLDLMQVATGAVNSLVWIYLES